MDIFFVFSTVEKNPEILSHTKSDSAVCLILFWRQIQALNFLLVLMSETPP